MTRKISKMQPIGNAATELRALAFTRLTQEEAVHFLDMADNSIVHLPAGQVLSSRFSDIEWTLS
jgi:hypothetical protein